MEINVKIKKAEKVNGDRAAFFKFQYHVDLVHLIRQCDNRHWHKDEKIWETELNFLPFFIGQIKNFPIKIHDEIIEGKEPKKKAVPDDFSFKTEPFKHQMDGFFYGLEKDRWLLADEQGLGKTKQVIDIAIAKQLEKGYQYCLIVCGVNGLKWNWLNEIEIHSNEKGWILGTRYNKNGQAKIDTSTDKLYDLKHLPSAYFLITNVESLRNEAIQKKIKQLCDDKIIGMVAIDEIHKCKNPSSQQGRAILKLKPETRIAMTGTPLMNHPLDLYITLKWLDYEKHSFYQFKNHHCIMGGFGAHQIMGYRYLDELQKTLNEIMLRRRKKEVLDLPDKLHNIEYVEMTTKQAIIYKEVLNYIRANVDKIVMTNNPLSELIRLRQATGYTGILSDKIQESAKLDRMDELVEELTENGQKVMIFSNWTSITDEAYRRLKKYDPAIITGQINDNQRSDEVKKFMNDDSCRVIIGTIGAMGTGLTLTAANTVIFLDSPWNRALKEQAEDRAHRIGTKSNVNIITIVCKDTIDERIEALVHKKGMMSDILVDGKIKGEKANEVLQYLLS